MEKRAQSARYDLRSILVRRSRGKSMNRGKTLQLLFLISLLLCMLSSIPLQCQEGPSNVPLIEALREGNLTEARRIVRSGAKLDILDNYGDTPLFHAIRSGYTDFAEELLSAGADPKFTSGGGTSLMVAAWYCDLRIARELLERGVAVDAADVKGQTALMHASQTCLDGKMVQLLLDAAADPKAKTADGSTALMSAASTGNALAAEKLLKAGADPAVKDKYGHTAEDNACDRGERGHAQVCALLHEALRTR